jgi:hypothetical protein
LDPDSNSSKSLDPDKDSINLGGTTLSNCLFSL